MYKIGRIFKVLVIPSYYEHHYEFLSTQTTT